MLLVPLARLAWTWSLPLTILAAIALSRTSANAAKLWNWQYMGAGITAAGTFTTVDPPNADGGYLITAIAGTRNGETITSLQPAHTSIPGNEPFEVDNLVFLGPGAQLSGDGFGFATSGGNYSNPFYASFLPVPGYLEFFSTPPFTGMPGPGDSELDVQFSATPVPEPSSCAFVLVALVSLGLIVNKRSTATTLDH